MEQRRKGPKKGAARKWAEKFKKMREQRPPKELMDILNQVEDPKDELKKVATPRRPLKDVEA